MFKVSDSEKKLQYFYGPMGSQGGQSGVQDEEHGGRSSSGWEGGCEVAEDRGCSLCFMSLQPELSPGNGVQCKDHVTGSAADLESNTYLPYVVAQVPLLLSSSAPHRLIQGPMAVLLPSRDLLYSLWWLCSWTGGQQWGCEAAACSCQGCCNPRSRGSWRHLNLGNVLSWTSFRTGATIL